MPIKLFILIFSTFALSFLCTALARKLSCRYNVLNNKNIPHVGGISIGISFLAAGILSGLNAGLLIASLLMLIFGIIDDARELSVAAKLSAQIICAAILIASGTRTHIALMGNSLNILVTFIWVIGITNAINHLDIQDGLAGGAGIIITLAFLSLSLSTGDTKSAGMSLVILAALIGFLPFNFPRATVFMGNAGSHLLGFVLSALALNISYATMERRFALFAPLFILGFPIFDTAFLIFVRARQGRSALLKSNDHLALRMLKIGFSKNKTLIIMLALTLVFAACGLLIARVPNIFAALLLMLLAFISLFVFKVMGGVTIDG